MSPGAIVQATEIIIAECVRLIADPIPISVRVERAATADAVEVFLVHGIGPAAIYRKVSARFRKDRDYGCFFEELATAAKDATKSMLAEMIPDLKAAP